MCDGVGEEVVEYVCEGEFREVDGDFSFEEGVNITHILYQF